MLKTGYTSPSSSAAAATHSVHVTVDLQYSAMVASTPVVARGMQDCDQFIDFTAASSRTLFQSAKVSVTAWDHSW